MRHTTSAEKALTAIYLRPMQPKADLYNKELNYAKTLVKLNSAWMVSQAKEFREYWSVGEFLGMNHELVV